MQLHTDMVSPLHSRCSSTLLARWRSSWSPATAQSTLLLPEPIQDSVSAPKSRHVISVGLCVAEFYQLTPVNALSIRRILELRTVHFCEQCDSGPLAGCDAGPCGLPPVVEIARRGGASSGGYKGFICCRHMVSHPHTRSSNTVS